MDQSQSTGHPIVSNQTLGDKPPTDGHVYLALQLNVKFSINTGGLFGHVDITNVSFSKYIRLPDAVRLIEKLDPSLSTPKAVYNQHGILLGVGLVDTEGTQKPMPPTKVEVVNL